MFKDKPKFKICKKCKKILEITYFKRRTGIHGGICNTCDICKLGVCYNETTK